MLPEGTTNYENYAHEDEFRLVSVSALKPGLWMPHTVRVAAAQFYLSLVEVDETAQGAPQTLLSPAPQVKNALVTDPRGPASVPAEGSLSFPWRVIVVGETPGRLRENSRLVAHLAPASVLPLARAEADWIKPGKAIRDTTLSMPGGIACVDFAAANGLQYVLYDAGWYGAENDGASDKIQPPWPGPAARHRPRQEKRGGRFLVREPPRPGAAKRPTGPAVRVVGRCRR